MIQKWIHLGIISKLTTYTYRYFLLIFCCFFSFHSGFLLHLKNIINIIHLENHHEDSWRLIIKVFEIIISDLKENLFKVTGQDLKATQEPEGKPSTFQRRDSRWPCYLESWKMEWEDQDFCPTFSIHLLHDLGKSFASLGLSFLNCNPEYLFCLISKGRQA